MATYTPKPTALDDVELAAVTCDVRAGRGLDNLTAQRLLLTVADLEKMLVLRRGREADLESDEDLGQGCVIVAEAGL